jgi:chemotaxis protein MotB
MPRHILNRSKWLGVMAISFGLVGCVSSGTHKATLAKLQTCETDLSAAAGERDACQGKVKDLQGQVASLKSQRDDEAKKRAAAEAQTADLTKNLNSTAQELDSLRKQKAEAEKRYAAQRALTERFRKMIDSGKIKISLRGGRMIMNLPSGVLFASGKADLSPEGKGVLTEVASVLKEFPDRKFVIAGHTDNAPLRGSKLKDNWELSTTRALTVTKFLVAAGVAPTALSAAGYGEFDPIADNKDDAGKQENRRIEIILVPNIEELPIDPEQPPAPAGGPVPSPAPAPPPAPPGS